MAVSEAWLARDEMWQHFSESHERVALYHMIPTDHLCEIVREPELVDRHTSSDDSEAASHKAVRIEVVELKLEVDCLVSAGYRSDLFGVIAHLALLSMEVEDQEEALENGIVGLGVLRIYLAVRRLT